MKLSRVWGGWASELLHHSSLKEAVAVCFFHWANWTWDCATTWRKGTFLTLCVWSEGNFYMKHHPGQASEQPSPIHPTVSCFGWRAVTNTPWLESLEERRQASHLQVPTQELGTMSPLLRVTFRASHIDMRVGLCCFGQWYYVAPC